MISPAADRREPSPPEQASRQASQHNNIMVRSLLSYARSCFRASDSTAALAFACLLLLAGSAFAIAVGVSVHADVVGLKRQISALKRTLVHDQEIASSAQATSVTSAPLPARLHALFLAQGIEPESMSFEPSTRANKDAPMVSSQQRVVVRFDASYRDIRVLLTSLNSALPEASIASVKLSRHDMEEGWLSSELILHLPADAAP